MGAHRESERVGFRADIQGLRGVAVLLVVLFHIDGSVPGGFIGVDIFFVISGYLIIGHLLREIATTGALRLSEFLARRVRRILPVLTLVLITSLLALVLVHPLGGAFDDSVGTARAAALLFANVAIYRGGGYFGERPESNAFLHTWSLSVEEQLYIGIPLALVLVSVLVRRRAAQALVASSAVLGVLLVASFGLGVALALTPSAFPLEAAGRFGFLMPVTRAWQFVVGGFVALLVIRSGDASGSSRGTMGGPLLTFGVVAILISAIAFGPGTAFPGLAALLPTLGAASIIHAGSSARGSGGAVVRSLSSRGLRWVGDRSYSWYLWHWPFIVLGSAVGLVGAWWGAALAVASLVLSDVSYRRVERPFRGLDHLQGRRATTVASVLIVVPAVLATLVLAGSSRLAEESLPAARFDGLGVGELLEFRGPIDVDPWHCSRTPTVCSDAPPDPTLLVVGDSLAEAAFVGIRHGAERKGWTARIMSLPGCAFLVGVASGRDDESIGDCSGFSTAVLAVIDSVSPDVVIIHQYSLGYVGTVVAGSDTGRTGVRPIGASESSSEASAPDVYAAGLSAAIGEIESRGSDVVVVSALPDFDAEPSVRYPTFVGAAIGRQARLNQDAVPLEAMRRRTDVGLRPESTAVIGTSAVVLDPVPEICAVACSRFDGDVPLFRDPIHLTPAGAARVGHLVADVIPSPIP